MANYFSKFPKLFYSYDSFNTAELITNIMARFSLEKSTKENTAVYYEYDVTEGDTPEIVASKMYDSPERHWIVLLFNVIVVIGQSYCGSTISFIINTIQCLSGEL